MANGLWLNAGVHSSDEPSVIQPSAMSSGARGFTERRERADDALVIRLVPRIVEHLAVPHDPVLVDDKDRALRDAFEPDHVFVVAARNIPRLKFIHLCN